MSEVDSPHALITASRVNGAAVYNPAGERIGHIDDLSIDKVSGQVRYALLAFGGFLGIGETFHPLPWPVLEYEPRKDGYVVPLDKEELRAAPNYTREELAAFGAGDRGYRDAVYSYYGRWGASPYWLGVL
jgi:hypothetical protein